MDEVSDLVQDSKLDTRFHSQYVYHVYHESDSTKGQRAVQRREYWRRTKHLGSGGFGSVWLEQCVKGKQEGEVRAVKEIQRPRNKFECNRELEAIAKFSHEKYARCFAKSFGWYEQGNTFYLAMEYFPRGDLQGFLGDTPHPLPETEVQQITYQILEGLKFMHDNGFAHRDIKPANILVQSRPPEDETWWIKISDFGISKRFRDSQGVSSTVKGTLAFMAPELHGFSVPGHEADPKSPNAVDMWALGEIIHQSLTKKPVFENMAALFNYTKGIQAFPQAHLQQHGITAAATALIMVLMLPAPLSRVTAELALLMEWLAHLRPPPSPPPEELELPDLPDMLSSMDFEEGSARWTTVESVSSVGVDLRNEYIRNADESSLLPSVYGHSSDGYQPEAASAPALQELSGNKSNTTITHNILEREVGSFKDSNHSKTGPDVHTSPSLAANTTYETAVCKKEWEATPPQPSRVFRDSQSQENTPKRKHKSNSSSFVGIPKISRWSKTTATSGRAAQSVGTSTHPAEDDSLIQPVDRERKVGVLKYAITPSLICRCEKDSRNLACFQFSHDSSILALGYAKGDVEIYDCQAGQLKYSFRAFSDIKTIAVDLTRGLVACGFPDGDITVWDFYGNKFIALSDTESGRDGASAIHFSQKGTFFLFSFKRSSVPTGWKLDGSSTKLRFIEAHALGDFKHYKLNHVKISTSGTLLAVQMAISEGKSEPEYSIHIFDIAEEKYLAQSPIPPMLNTNFAFSPDGSFLAYTVTSKVEPSIVVWDIAQNFVRHRIFTYHYSNLAFTHSGDFLAGSCQIVFTGANWVHLWDCTASFQGDPVSMCSGSSKILALAFSPDNTLIGLRGELGASTENIRGEDPIEIYRFATQLDKQTIAQNTTKLSYPVPGTRRSQSSQSSEYSGGGKNDGKADSRQSAHAKVTPPSHESDSSDNGAPPYTRRIPLERTGTPNLVIPPSVESSRSPVQSTVRDSWLPHTTPTIYYSKTCHTLLNISQKDSQLSAFSPDGATFAVFSSHTRRVKVWSMTGKKAITVSGNFGFPLTDRFMNIFKQHNHSRMATCIAVHHRRIAVGHESGEVTQWRMDGQQDSTSSEPHSGKVEHIAYARDDGIMLSYNSKENVAYVLTRVLPSSTGLLLVDVPSRRLAHAITTCAAISACGKFVALGLRWKESDASRLRRNTHDIKYEPIYELQIVNINTKISRANPKALSEECFSVAFSPDGDLLALETRTCVKILEIPPVTENGEMEIRTITSLQDFKISAQLAFSHDSKVLAVLAAKGNTFHIWYSRTGAWHKVMWKHETIPSMFLPDSYRGKVDPRMLTGPLSFLPDGRLVAVLLVSWGTDADTSYVDSIVELASPEDIDEILRDPDANFTDAEFNERLEKGGVKGLSTTRNLNEYKWVARPGLVVHRRVGLY